MENYRFTSGNDEKAQRIYRIIIPKHCNNELAMTALKALTIKHIVKGFKGGGVLFIISVSTVFDLSTMWWDSDPLKNPS